MTQRIDLEICVESVEAALQAERGGADRVELCADLAVGGVTPSAAVMKQAREILGRPVHVIIRPRAGDFFYSAREFEIMKRQIESAQRLGMNGVVLGILNADRTVDGIRTRELVELADPLPVTFHRAFDETRDLFEALEAVMQTGATRLLTSGGKAKAPQALPVLAELVKHSAGRIGIMPGSGIDASNAVHLIEQTGVREIHASLGSALLSDVTLQHDEAWFEEKVRAVKTLLRQLESRNGSKAESTMSENR
jgi:copper homeostasis protein